MTLYTEEIKIIALNADELRLFCEDIPRLEEKLGVIYKAEPMTGAFRHIVRGQLEKALSDKENFIWYTFWLIVKKSERVVMGSADFKGAPDEKGCVEIGYGLNPEFEHKGYMTKTVSAMRDWALANGARAVTADTEPSNLRSQACLERCGFRRIQDHDGLLQYIYEGLSADECHSK